MSAVAAQTTCPTMILPSGVAFLLRVTGDATVDVDFTVLHCHAGGSFHIAENRCTSFPVQTAGITFQLSP